MTINQLKNELERLIAENKGDYDIISYDGDKNWGSEITDEINLAILILYDDEKKLMITLE